MAPPPSISDAQIETIAADADAVLIYSRRTAEAFRDLVVPRVSAAALARMTVLAISAKAAAPLAEAGFRELRVATYTDDEAMMSLALAFARGQNTA
jgi:uroporphyrinogen-III synthase